MDAVPKLLKLYAAGGEVGRIDDTSDWSYFFALEGFFSFPYFYFFEADFDSYFEGDFGDLEFYFSLLFDLPDLTDLSPSTFFLLFESPAIWIYYWNNIRNLLQK